MPLSLCLTASGALVGGNIATEVIPISTADFFLTNRKEWLKYQKSQIEGADNVKSSEGFLSARASLLQGDYNKADKGIERMRRAPLGQFEYTADLIFCFFDRLPTIDVVTSIEAEIGRGKGIGTASGTGTGTEPLSIKDEKKKNGIHTKKVDTSQVEGNFYFDGEKTRNTESTRSDVRNRIGKKNKSKNKNKNKSGRKLQDTSQSQKTVKYGEKRIQRSERKIDSQNRGSDNNMENNSKHSSAQFTELESGYPLVKPGIELANVGIGFLNLFDIDENRKINAGKEEEIINQYDNGENKQNESKEVDFDDDFGAIAVRIETENNKNINIFDEVANISKESREDVEISYFNHKTKEKEKSDNKNNNKNDKNHDDNQNDNANDDQNDIKNHDDNKNNSNRRKLKTHVGGGREKIINTFKNTINFPFLITDYVSDHEISFLDSKNAVATTQHISVTRHAKV